MLQAHVRALSIHTSIFFVSWKPQLLSGLLVATLVFNCLKGARVRLKSGRITTPRQFRDQVVSCQNAGEPRSNKKIGMRYAASSRQLAIFGTIEYFIDKNIVFVSAHNDMKLNHVG